jgi:hypothetical protein
LLERTKTRSVYKRKGKKRRKRSSNDRKRKAEREGREKEQRYLHDLVVSTGLLRVLNKLLLATVLVLVVEEDLFFSSRGAVGTLDLELVHDALVSRPGVLVEEEAVLKREESLAKVGSKKEEGERTISSSGMWAVSGRRKTRKGIETTVKDCEKMEYESARENGRPRGEERERTAKKM